ncbi:hypothetical protein CC2G_009695 [Coprinopsis cinerea AmutBmut pab1-1]|nr:hypothetical protein CC2G_009695 [Coprinopsis cinerea AmutBmut pab1-1]
MSTLCKMGAQIVYIWDHSIKLFLHLPVHCPMHLSDLPPELFLNIAAHLPLYAVPSTLLSLASTNHRLYGIAYPLLHSHLILKNEEDTLCVLGRLIDDANLGRFVRGIHLTTALSREVRLDHARLDVVRTLQKLIHSGNIPNLSTLEVHLLLYSWYEETDPETGIYTDFEGFGEFRNGFWKSLQRFCPQLKNIAVTGIRDTDDGYLNQSGIFELQAFPNVTCFTVSLSSPHFDDDGVERLRRSVSVLSGRLRTLNVTLTMLATEVTFDGFLDLTFPCLESLGLTGWVLNDRSKMMEFWQRHQNLHSISLVNRQEIAWFLDSAGVTGDLLPKLKILRASFINVRNLAPILHRLLKLEILASFNAQVPYLLRYVLPSGIPKLKSLLIEQASGYSGNFRVLEGAHWYETADGEFKEADKFGKSRYFKSMTDGYLHSIVRGAPNLEELALKGPDLNMANHVSRPHRAST